MRVALVAIYGIMFVWFATALLSFPVQFYPVCLAANPAAGHFGCVLRALVYGW